MQILWDAFYRVAAELWPKLCSPSKPEVAPIDKASLGDILSAAGFSQQRFRWGDDVSVYAITSSDKVAVVDAASLGAVIRAVFDKVLLGNLHACAADVGGRAAKRKSADASAAREAAKPTEGA